MSFNTILMKRIDYSITEHQYGMIDDFAPFVFRISMIDAFEQLLPMRHSECGKTAVQKATLEY